MIHKRYGEEISFLDVLMNMALLFIFISALLMMMVNPKKKQDANARVKAEYVITVEWPEDRPVDVDTYLRDPTGKVLFYQAREHPLMHLDRDDTGWSNDNITLADGTTISYPYNREITTLRGTIVGEYILNLHYYGEGNSRAGGSPIIVNVVIEKLNPQVRLIYSEKVLLNQVGDEAHVIRFTMGADGEISKTQKLPVKFVGINR
jgi:hypothetical protein